METRLVKLDGWMTCNFTSFSTVFQLYQDSGSVAPAPNFKKCPNVSVLKHVNVT